MAKSKVTKVTVNFKGVDKEIRKHSGKSARVPEGDYLVKILDGEVKPTKDEDGHYINWRCQIVKPKKYKGKTLYGMTSLNKKALFNLRNLINAAFGKNVAGKTGQAIDTTKFEGKIVGATAEDNEYNNKVTSRINAWWPASEYDDPKGGKDDEDEDDEDLEEVEEEEEEKPKKKDKKAKAKDKKGGKKKKDKLDKVDVDKI